MLLFTVSTRSALKARLQAFLDLTECARTIYLPTEYAFSHCILSTLSQTVTNKLQSIYDSQWFSNISNSQPKLRTYCKFKTTFHCENYLLAFTRSQRLAFSKLRISAHKLLIEAGRYTIPRIEPNARICKQCNLNEVEDEFHFIMHCKLYDDLRSTFMSELNDIIVTTNFNEDDYFNTIMGAKDTDILKKVLNFVNLAFTKRFNNT